MVTKEELVKIANRLDELSREEDIYGWMTSGKGIQMRAATLRRLFPDVTFDEQRHENLGEWIHLGTVWNGCEFFCLVTLEEYEKYKAPLEGQGEAYTYPLQEEIREYAEKMDDLTAKAKEYLDEHYQGV